VICFLWPEGVSGAAMRQKLQHNTGTVLSQLNACEWNEKLQNACTSVSVCVAMITNVTPLKHPQ
jgi:hypothetical protein